MQKIKQGKSREEGQDQPTELNLRSTNCNRRQLLPTPVSPITTIYTIKAQVRQLEKSLLKYSEATIHTEILGTCCLDIFDKYAWIY